MAKNSWVVGPGVSPVQLCDLIILLFVSSDRDPRIARALRIIGSKKRGPELENILISTRDKNFVTNENLEVEICT